MCKSVNWNDKKKTIYWLRLYLITGLQSSNQQLNIWKAACTNESSFHEVNCNFFVSPFQSIFIWSPHQIWWPLSTELLFTADWVGLSGPQIQFVLRQQSSPLSWQILTEGSSPKRQCLLVKRYRLTKVWENRWQ